MEMEMERNDESVAAFGRGGNPSSMDAGVDVAKKKQGRRRRRRGRSGGRAAWGSTGACRMDACRRPIDGCCMRHARDWAGPRTGVCRPAAAPAADQRWCQAIDAARPPAAALLVC